MLEPLKFLESLLSEAALLKPDKDIKENIKKLFRERKNGRQDRQAQYAA